MSHSGLPPSSASIWSKCHGWVLMNYSVEEKEETEESRIGTAVHEIAESIILGKGVPALANGISVTEEMKERASIYAEDVLSVVLSKSVTNWGVEQKISINSIHPECYGTSDCFAYFKDIHTLFIWDYKDGFGVVEARNNAQLITYYAGIIEALGIVNDQTLKVIMRIVQPRSFHPEGSIREWKIMGSDLRPHINIIHNAAQDNMNGTGVCRAGEHCRYCNALFACPTALTHAMAIFEVTNKPMPAEPSPEEMAFLYELIERGKKQFEYLSVAYETKLISLLTKGARVPGWKMEQKFGYRKWNDNVDIDEIVSVGKELGVDLLKAPTLITPTQARDKKLDKDVLAAYSHVPTAGLKLVKQDPSKALKAFLPNK